MINSTRQILFQIKQQQENQMVSNQPVALKDANKNDTSVEVENNRLREQIYNQYRDKAQEKVAQQDQPILVKQYISQIEPFNFDNINQKDDNIKQKQDTKSKTLTLSRKHDYSIIQEQNEQDETQIEKEQDRIEKSIEIVQEVEDSLQEEVGDWLTQKPVYTQKQIQKPTVKRKQIKQESKDNNKKEKLDKLKQYYKSKTQIKVKENQIFETVKNARKEIYLPDNKRAETSKPRNKTFNFVKEKIEQINKNLQEEEDDITQSINKLDQMFQNRQQNYKELLSKNQFFDQINNDESKSESRTTVIQNNNCSNIQNNIQILNQNNYNDQKDDLLNDPEIQKYLRNFAKNKNKQTSINFPSINKKQQKYSQTLGPKPMTLQQPLQQNEIEMVNNKHFMKNNIIKDKAKLLEPLPKMIQSSLYSQNGFNSSKCKGSYALIGKIKNKQHQKIEVEQEDKSEKSYLVTVHPNYKKILFG